MKFLQVIEFKSSRIDEMAKIGDDFVASIGADNKARRELIAEDRENRGTYFQLIFFDSYEEAMENSNHPATQKIAARMAELADGEPKFYNLDIVEERDM